jgi:hypothetical protein
MNEIENLYRKVELATSGEEPLACAGVLMAQALKIYKVVLNEEEFNKMTTHILNTTDQIIVDKPTLN